MVSLGPLGGPNGWWMRVAHQEPSRLVVFVHGYRGRPDERTWGAFAFEDIAADKWWQEADMLFVGYALDDNPQSVAELLMRKLGDYYPKPREDVIHLSDAAARALTGTYTELFVVGHSLGGLIVRRALMKAAQELLEWNKRWAILEAQVRLFSPANGGFRPAGVLGVLRGAPAWTLIESWLRRNSSFSDLQPDSSLIRTTKSRTEDLVSKLPTPERESLRAHILWADNENVVERETYETDFPDRTAFHRNHSNVCKPDTEYATPWRFAQVGNQP